MKRAVAMCGVLCYAILFGAACCNVRPPAPPGDAFTVTRTTGRFIIYGDTRRHAPFERIIRRVDYEKEREPIAPRLAAEKSDFIVHTGDVVAVASRESQWEEWEREMEPVTRAEIPLYVAYGNHEYTGSDAEAMRHVAAHFPRVERRHWYALRYDRILVVVLDSNFSELAGGEIAAQDAWLERTLAAAEADAGIRHVILAAHHSPYTNSATHSPDGDSQLHFVARAKAAKKVHVYVSGHVHNYERFFIDGIHFVVAGGGGAPKTHLDLEHPRFKDEFRGPEVRPFQYVLFTLEADRLVVDVIMLEADGTWPRADGFTVE